jgi:isoleucyl-tRNA synthetase
LRTDYKDTLNLPQTGFPKKADLVAREPLRLKKWQTGGLYQRIQEQRAGGPKFVLHDGPPFANGDVHIGTALNKILKDIIIKYKTLRGFSAPYIPGWDCHGLPIEYRVMQEIKSEFIQSNLNNLSRNFPQRVLQEPFTKDAMVIRNKCEERALNCIEFADGSGQRQQFKRLGVLGDWGSSRKPDCENPYLTLNKKYEADELRLFADIVEKGFVYRGKKPVYWCIPCRTALDEAEVEYAEHVSQSVFVKFPAVQRGAFKNSPVVPHPNTFILIWTTTPWTLPANLAVAYNSTLKYSLVKVASEEYWMLTSLVQAIAEKCQWEKPEIILSVDGWQLAALDYQHPFCKRTGQLYAGDDFVESGTGTGFVHIAPGHGKEDYNLARQHGLQIYSPINDDGAFAHTSDLPVEQQMPAELLGKSTLERQGRTSDANEAILALLRAKNVLLHQEPYPHSYPHCWRSKTPIIFRAMDQWFIKIDHSTPEFEVHGDEAIKKGDVLMDDFERKKAGMPLGTLRLRALRAISYEVDWIPDWGKNRIEAAVKSRPDWCISRQRSWGVPIPAFYDAKGEPMLDAQIVRHAADLVEKHGSNIWFEKTAAELWDLVKPKNWQGAEAVSKSTDTLDVWIDSGSSSRAVLMRRPELAHETGQLAWQADMYLEGSDQHRGWFQSSLLLSLAGNGAAPYKTVLTHGFMVDADREKISKSKQAGYEKPQTAEAYVKKYGADVVRLWVASQDFRNDIVVSEERVNKVGETYRAIRNALRYQLSNLYDFDPVKHTVREDELTGLDRWILAEFSRLEGEVMAAYDQYEFHVVYQKVSQFIAVELSSIYHDVIKDRLYTDPANSPRRRSTQTALHRLVTGLCQMLAPILAFTADEAWEFVPGVSASVHESQWKRQGLQLMPDEIGRWDWLKLWREKLLPELEKARQAKIIGKALEAKVEIVVPQVQLQYSDADMLRELVNVSALKMSKGEGVSISVAKADGEKCERCWHWESDVGANPDYPGICRRCVEAVQEHEANKT